MSNNSTGRWITIIALVLVTANIVSLVFLWTKRPMHEMGPKGEMPPNERPFEFLNHELKFDSVQREQYRVLRDKHQATVRPLTDSLRRSKDAFFALLNAETGGDSLVMQRARQISSLEEQLNMATFRHFQKLRLICTADQKKKFDELIQDVLRRMAPPKQQGPPPMRPGAGRPGMPPPPGEEGPPPAQ